MRALTLLARRSVAPIAGLAIAGIDVWLASLAMTPGMRLWADVVTGLTSAALPTGTLAAGIAAFEANRWSNANRDRTMVGVREPVLVRAQHAAAVALPVLAGYLLALGILGVIAALTGTYGSPAVLWLASLGAGLLLATAVGYWAGSAFGAHWFVAPVGALTFVVGYVAATVGLPVFGMRALFPAGAAMDSVFTRTVDLTFLGKSACWLGLTVILVVTSRGSRRPGTARRVPTIVVLVAGLTAVTGGVVVIAENGQVTAAYNSRDFVCENDGFTLCLNRGYAVAMQPLHAAFAALNSRVDGTPLAAARLEQNVEGIGDLPARGARSVYVERLSSPSDIEFAVERYVKKYGAAPHCGVESIGVPAVDYVDTWLSGADYFSDGSPEPARLSALKRLSASEGNAWFRAHASAYFSCSLTLADLP
ncbi:hypothetical protein [Galbitalea soli]|uniref:Uncharacterized protein n=1 Tax=Galbitalea soli TaxID=1268042 RepID=A0A7C9PP72_9MICO|nr:hypothetical protein [Galbitalea soli]NEM92152.1 hypothetical protein [Galbitalea soli]NYJ31895.1 hypothetical protein [Galbitalea soli]